MFRLAILTTCIIVVFSHQFSYDDLIDQEWETFKVSVKESYFSYLLSFTLQVKSILEYYE